jgi:hypothetical protein
MKHGWSAIIGVGLSLVLLSLVMTPTYASDGGIIIQMDAPEPKLHTGAESTVDFNVNHLSKILTTYKVEITNRWEFDAEGDRSTRVTHTIYSNGIHVDEITSSYDIHSGRGAQDYGLIVVPIKTLRVGENTIKITISLNSMAPEPRTSPEYLKFIIDSAVVTENYRLTTVLTMLLVSIGIVSKKVGGAKSLESLEF